MAPEQGLRPGTVDIRADVYALGCTLYKLLAGDSPFSAEGGDSHLKVLAAHALSPVPPMDDRRPGLPDGLERLILRMLAKDPAARPSTPGEVAHALAPFAEGADLRPWPPAPSTPPWRPTPRPPASASRAPGPIPRRPPSPKGTPPARPSRATPQAAREP